MTLDIHRMVVGPLQVNCFLLMDSSTREAALVDPGGDPAVILDTIEQNNAHVKSIVLTHAHGDHIGAVDEVRSHTSAEVVIHEAEGEWLEEPSLNLSSLLGMPVTARAADRFIGDGDSLQIGQQALRVLHTPGHSPGGISLYREHLLFCGDLLFQQSIGRSDLPGGDFQILMESIQQRVLPLPDTTVVYPGHGEYTTVGFERKNNPFIPRGSTEKGF